MSKIILFHGTFEKNVIPTYGLGEAKHDYEMGFYLTDNIELAKEWAVCRPNVTNGWVHQYELDTEELKILETSDVAYIKQLGRTIKNYNENAWNGVRQIIVYEGLTAKFSQNQFLKEQLLNTKECLLAECAVKDKIWGIGLSMTDTNRLDQSKWSGQNLLGYTLMMVRKQLKNGADTM